MTILAAKFLINQETTMKKIKLKIVHAVRSIGRRLKIKNLEVQEPKEEEKKEDAE